MSNDFKSYAKNSKNLSQADKEKIAKRFSSSDIQKAENFTKQYENMSEGQLLGEIQKMAQSGGVNQNELNAFVNNVMPMLDNEQKAKLQTVLKTLKR